MNIAIVEDELIFREKIIQMVGKFKDDYKLTVYSFENGNSIMNWLNTNPTIDILICDIQLPDINGLTLVETLHKRDANTIIIFLTNYEKYAIETFQFKTFRYLLKSFDDKKILGELSKAFKQWQFQHTLYAIQYQSKTSYLEIPSIIYVESIKRKVLFYTQSYVYETYELLSRAEKELKPYGFLRIHKSFVINMAHVKSYQGFQFKMSNNDLVDIGHNRRSSVMKQFNSFIATRTNNLKQ